jgi:hypothetical protein
MSLATKSTKTVTVWTDNAGESWDSQDAAEHKSVANTMGRYGLRLNPSYLVTTLKQEPEVMKWLLEQLGVEPMLPKTYNYKELARILRENTPLEHTSANDDVIAFRLQQALAPYFVQERTEQEEAVDIPTVLESVYMRKNHKYNGMTETYKSVIREAGELAHEAGYVLVKKQA